jgi:Domain of unknown function (DUF4157)
MKLPEDIKVVENSRLAQLAAWKLHADAVALVLGKTIHLHNISHQQFLANHRWVKHELKHVEQYQRMGFLPFLWKYLWFTFKYGYRNNPLEREARAAEEN